MFIKSRYEFCSLPEYTHCILRFKLVTNKLPQVGKPDEFMTSPGSKKLTVKRSHFSLLIRRFQLKPLKSSSKCGKCIIHFPTFIQQKCGDSQSTKTAYVQYTLTLNSSERLPHTEFFFVRLL